MGKPYFVLIASVLFCWNAIAQTNVDELIDQLESKPYKIPKASSESNQTIYSRYCTGKAYDLEKPEPKYNNSLVKSSAKILKQTQKDADAKLLEMFKEGWVQNNESIKESLQEIKKSSNPIVVNMAEKLENSLDITATKFSGEQNQWLENIVDALYVDVKNSLSILKEVAVEFKGVNYQKITNLMAEFKKQIESEIKAVDAQNMKTLLESFKPEVSSHTGSVNIEDIKIALIFLQSEFNELKSQNPEFGWIAEAIGYSLIQLEKDEPEFDEFKYVLQDMKDFFTNETFSTTFSDESVKKYEYLSSEKFKISAKDNIASIDSLISSIDNYLAGKAELNELRWVAQDLEFAVREYAKVSTDANFKANAKSFSAEVASFESASVMEIVNQIDAILNDDDSSNDLGAVSRISSLNHRIQSVKVLLSQKSLDKFSILHSESNAVNQERIKKSLSELIDLTTTTTGVDFLEQASWKVSSLSEGFDNQKTSLSALSQEKIEAFVVISEQFKQVFDLEYQMSSDYEIKKAGHFYFYGAVKRIYKVNSGSAPYGRLAHTFLVQLCGEFRDRATMIEAKLNWIQRLYTIDETHSGSEIDYDKNIWSQMSAEDYGPFLSVTRELWQARKNAGDVFIKIGKHQSIDAPVKGPTVCETKYIFDKYIKKGVSFDSLEQYENDFNDTYKVKCKIAADLVDYYDFRGDSNFKHYSPESNAMIWKATSIARGCSSQWKAKGTVSGAQNKYTDEDCKDYFKRPFYYRYNAARSAIATGLVYDSAFDDSFDSEGNAPVTVYSHMKPQYGPMAFETETSDGVTFGFDADWLGLKQWNKPDLGFNDFTGLGSANPNMELAYERLRGSVDRHTNWYSAGYDDGNGTVKDQAFSPFVASSYVMSASDEFTTCGITVQCPPDGLKRWMFIFRVKPENWYNPQRILNNEPIDLDKMWFDETSFGDSGLANGESAWDRMGTAMESELDSILYLINVESEGFDHGEFGDEPELEDLGH